MGGKRVLCAGSHQTSCFKRCHTWKVPRGDPPGIHRSLWLQLPCCPGWEGSLCRSSGRPDTIFWPLPAVPSSPQLARHKGSLFREGGREGGSGKPPGGGGGGGGMSWVWTIGGPHLIHPAHLAPVSYLLGRDSTRRKSSYLSFRLRLSQKVVEVLKPCAW